jgi:glycosyltransferase involved in cell wall biosynthesis
MRIAVWHNLPAGGAKRALHDHVRGLLGRGHQIEAWCPPTANRSFLPLAAMVTEHVVPLGRGPSEPAWNRGRFGPLRSPRPLARAMRAHASECARQIDAAGFDVCLASTCQFFGAPPLAHDLVVPKVLYLQEPNRWLYEANPDLPWLTAPSGDGDRRLLRPVKGSLELIRLHRRSQRARFEVDNARGFDRVLVNSLFSRETVLRVYGIDAEVCYLGVDTEVFKPTGATREDIVVGVGAIAPHKNPQLLVDAVARLPQPRPRVAWVGASKNPAYAESVRRSAVELEVELDVREAADDETLVDLLNRSRVLVYSSRLEPFGLVPLEANGCELPVVAVAEAGIRETVVDGLNGLLVSSEPEQIGNAIRRLFEDPELAARLGQDGRDWVERAWTLEQAASRLERALSKVVNALQPAAGG